MKYFIVFFLLFSVVSCGGGGGSSSDGEDSSPVWQPDADTGWTIQLTGALNTSYDTDVYDIDLFDNSAETIETLKQSGIKVVCYFSAGSYENWRDDASLFPSAAVGNALEDWEGENWLDIRNSSVREIMRQRIELAASKGCDAVDADNVDGYSNDTGFDLTYADQLSFNRFIAATAHDNGLAAGLKNDLGQISDLVNYFEFAVNESCFDYDECSGLLPFVQSGKPVFGIEYDLAPEQFCSDANDMGFNFLYMPELLDGSWRTACR